MADTLETKSFDSGMTGAPVLSGTAGALIAILDAVLVTGFGLQTATSVVVASGIATATYATAHAFRADTVALFAGATPSGLNGEKRILAVVSDKIVTFDATGISDQTATGTITSKVSPAGWTKAFTGTNLAAYKITPPEGTGFYLRVDDTGTTNARVCGYETMSDINTGVGAFPTAAQLSGGGYWAKSDAASAAARPWVLFADTRKFYLHGVPYGFGGATHGFGDDLATRPGGDPYACSLSYYVNSTLASMWSGAYDEPAALQIAMPRAFTGLGSSALHAVYPYTGSAGALSGADASLGDFPSEVDGSLQLSRRYLAVPGRAPRCNVPGLYSVPQSAAFTAFKRLDVIPGTGALAGRKLMVVNTSNAFSSASTTANTGVSVVDITGPWR